MFSSLCLSFIKLEKLNCFPECSLQKDNVVSRVVHDNELPCKTFCALCQSLHFYMTVSKSPSVYQQVNADVELNRARHQVWLKTYPGSHVGYSGLTAKRVSAGFVTSDTLRGHSSWPPFCLLL